jgi:phage terminase small subunit
MSGLTVKREAFAIAYVENGGDASKAYRASFNAENMKPESVWCEASKLLSDPKVSQRVEQLRAQVVERHTITVDDILKQIDEDREFARELEQAAPAISATTLKAKILGMLTDKVEHKVSISDTAAAWLNIAKS